MKINNKYLIIASTGFIVLFLLYKISYFDDIIYASNPNDISHLYRLTENKMIPEPGVEFICTVNENSFIGEKINKMMPHKNELKSLFIDLGDEFIGEGKNSLVFIYNNKKIAYIFSSKDKIYIDNELCLDATKANVVVKKEKNYVDISIKPRN